MEDGSYVRAHTDGCHHIAKLADGGVGQHPLHTQFTVAGPAAAITVWRSVAEGATTGVCGVGKIY